MAFNSIIADEELAMAKSGKMPESDKLSKVKTSAPIRRATPRNTELQSRGRILRSNEEGPQQYPHGLLHDDDHE
jgi:hypothetical protein